MYMLNLFKSVSLRHLHYQPSKLCRTLSSIMLSEKRAGRQTDRQACRPADRQTCRFALLSWPFKYTWVKSDSCWKARASSDFMRSNISLAFSPHYPWPSVSQHASCWRTCRGALWRNVIRKMSHRLLKLHTCHTPPLIKKKKEEKAFWRRILAE